MTNTGGRDNRTPLIHDLPRFYSQVLGRSENGTEVHNTGGSDNPPDLRAALPTGEVPYGRTVEIELRVISATDLKDGILGKLTCYAVVHIYQEQTKKTNKDSDGGTNPTWNEKLKFTCDEQQLLAGDLVITVEIYSEEKSSNKLIGTVAIPISEIAKDTIWKEVKEGKDGGEKEGKVKEKEHEAQHWGFEVRCPSGKAKGVLNAAIKFGDKRTIQVYHQAPPAGYAYGQSSSAPQGKNSATGYPVSPPAPGYPHQYPPQYPPQAYGAPPGAYPNQYPPQQVPYTPQQAGPYYPQQQPPEYYQERPRIGGGGRMGLGVAMAMISEFVESLMMSSE